MSEPTLPTVALDQAEAVELAEVCEFVARWLTGAGPAVDASPTPLWGSRVGASSSGTASSHGLSCW